MTEPLVLIDMKLRGYSSVNPDNHMGGYLATQHLISLGRERIAMISGSLGHYSIRERNRGYRQALYEAGMLADPRLETCLPDGVDLETGAYEAMQALLDQPHPPDAVFCYNDAAALVAMRACLAAGKTVPHDISIVGFDDIPGAVLGHRPLTTLRINKKELGALGGTAEPHFGLPPHEAVEVHVGTPLQDEDESRAPEARAEEEPALE